MNRFVIFVGAVLAASISVASACTAAPSEPINFTLTPERGSDSIQASFNSNLGRGHESNWSTGFRPAELAGLDVAGFRSAGSRPLRFALVREAGRLDCAGRGGDSRASGGCSFTPDPGFIQLLESRRIGRPTNEQALGLMAVNVRRELIDAIAAANYPTPTIDNLMALSALGIDEHYIAGMARAGYRPNTLDALVQFKALEITPQWIGGFMRIGYADLPADELMQLKALNIGIYRGVRPGWVPSPARRQARPAEGARHYARIRSLCRWPKRPDARRGQADGAQNGRRKVLSVRLSNRRRPGAVRRSACRLVDHGWFESPA